MPENMITLPTPEALIELISPQVVNLLDLMKLVKQGDRTVVVRMTMAVPMPEAYGLEVRVLRGVMMPFGGLVLRIETLESSDGWCWLEIEPYGAIDEEYFRTHWDAVYSAIKPLLDEVGAVGSGPRLGGASFVMPS